MNSIQDLLLMTVTGISKTRKFALQGSVRVRRTVGNLLIINGVQSHPYKSFCSRTQNVRKMKSNARSTPRPLPPPPPKKKAIALALRSLPSTTSSFRLLPHQITGQHIDSTIRRCRLARISTGGSLGLRFLPHQARRQDVHTTIGLRPAA